MNLYPIIAGKFKLDGGAMFGVVPKSIWSKTNPSDNNNMIDIAARCLLIEDGDRLVLIDTGMGNKQSEKFFSHYTPHQNLSLEKSLSSAGFSTDEITDVFLTHLHFDHCGGGINWNKKKNGYVPAFKNAKYWSAKKHWEWATMPNKREGASFLKENILPLEEMGLLNFVNKDKSSLFSKSSLGFEVFFADGHTEKQMIPIINYKGQKIAYTADLIPTAGHLPVPYITAYDVRPLISLKEKSSFLDFAEKNNILLFLEHDSSSEIISLKKTEKGIRVNDFLKLSDVL